MSSFRSWSVDLNIFQIIAITLTHLLYCDTNAFIAAETVLVKLCDALYDASSV